MSDLVDRYVEWARTRADVAGVALVGSHARGAARPDSDVDLMTLVDRPAALIADPGWVETFGAVERIAVEHWGAVTSLRVHFRDGPEVELGLTTPAWASTDPVDPGTARVVADGMRVLHDPRGLLGPLLSRFELPPGR